LGILPGHVKPDTGAVGTLGAYMSASPDVVSTTVAGVYTPSVGFIASGFLPLEATVITLNGTPAATFNADALGFIVFRLTPGNAEGYVSVGAIGQTSGRMAAATAQISNTGPIVPGLAVAPHAVRPGDPLYLYAVDYRPLYTVTVARDDLPIAVGLANSGGRLLVTGTVPITLTAGSVSL
jgi:hypothetical protein